MGEVEKGVPPIFILILIFIFIFYIETGRTVV